MRWPISFEPKSTSMMESPSARSFEARALSPFRMRASCSFACSRISSASASLAVPRPLVCFFPFYEKTKASGPLARVLMQHMSLPVS